MRGLIVILSLLLCFPAVAAESWGLPGEQEASFDGKVVDIQCALTGDCPKDCGAGRRQLGLLKKDGTLILAMKNADPFAGATRDLLPFCGKPVTVDGLFTSNEGVRAFALQRVKPPGGDWIAANGFARDWAKAHELKPGSPQLEEWYRHDEMVAARIKAEGKLGLGPEK
ncbi:hypothetical protein CU669_02185 [Paramagnetospirillum kuznetsovii]|uniref:Uncharacterized protein n=1 Tax=Paramagnetospirillum kuznetsovii TaxID=2053833 RepID=A0A364P3I0_9PROT|nr:hypothetical protein [Paramagnetospirillum kuznetsovii]RAU23902.1 hypothetical protein CU669_02185 [Paramagnetospirillum kuznetsovii]